MSIVRNYNCKCKDGISRRKSYDIWFRDLPSKCLGHRKMTEKDKELMEAASCKANIRRAFNEARYL